MENLRITPALLSQFASDGRLLIVCEEQGHERAWRTAMDERQSEEWRDVMHRLNEAEQKLRA